VFACAPSPISNERLASGDVWLSGKSLCDISYRSDRVNAAGMPLTLGTRLGP